MQTCGSKRFGGNAVCQGVDTCHTRDESEEPRGISGSTKKTFKLFSNNAKIEKYKKRVVISLTA